MKHAQIYRLHLEHNGSLVTFLVVGDELEKLNSKYGELPVEHLGPLITAETFAIIHPQAAAHLDQGYRLARADHPGRSDPSNNLYQQSIERAWENYRSRLGKDI